MTGNVNRPVRKSRTQIKNDLQAVISDLVERVGCTFWPCPGPNAPRADMETCCVCHAIKDLREIKKEI